MLARPAGALTATGTGLSAIVSSPSWPTPFQPQATTVPELVNARTWPACDPPAAIATILPAYGPRTTGAGVSTFGDAVLPLPSAPETLLPQASTLPSEVSATL